MLRARNAPRQVLTGTHSPSSIHRITVAKIARLSQYRHLAIGLVPAKHSIIGNIRQKQYTALPQTRQNPPPTEPRSTIFLLWRVRQSTPKKTDQLSQNHTLVFLRTYLALFISGIVATMLIALSSHTLCRILATHRACDPA